MDNNDRNDLDWKEYEDVTKYIYEMLGSEYGIRVSCHGKDCKVQGKSGVKHQVDVLTEQDGSERCHRTAIECKFRKSKVTKDTVMKLQSVMEDADIESGIIVCKGGFTKDTMTYAAHLGIKLVELREVGEDDYSGDQTISIGVLDIKNHVTITRPMITKIDLGSRLITEGREIMAMYHLMMHTLDQKEVPFWNYINGFRVELDEHNKLLSTITRSFAPVNGKLVGKFGDKEFAIEKITITGFLAKIDASSSSSFQLVDQVWMIMKEIFEKKTFTFSKSGKLYRLPIES